MGKEADISEQVRLTHCALEIGVKMLMHGFFPVKMKAVMKTRRNLGDLTLVLLFLFFF